MAKKVYGPAHDGLLAMISVLSVMFLVLFVSCAYFLTLREEIAQRDVTTMAELQRMQEVGTAKGNVAGYATEQMPYEPMFVDFDETR